MKIWVKMEENSVGGFLTDEKLVKKLQKATKKYQMDTIELVEVEEITPEEVDKMINEYKEIYD